MGKNTAVFGIYPTYSNAERAVDALREAGFRNTDIAVMMPENLGNKDLAHEKGTTAPEGAAAGAGAPGAARGGGGNGVASVALKFLPRMMRARRTLKRFSVAAAMF